VQDAEAEDDVETLDGVAQRACVHAPVLDSRAKQGADRAEALAAL